MSRELLLFARSTLEHHALRRNTSTSLASLLAITGPDLLTIEEGQPVPDLEQRVRALERRMDKVEKEREAIRLLATALGQQVKDLREAIESVRPVVMEMQKTQEIAKAVSESQSKFLAKTGRLLIYTASVTAAITTTVAVLVKWLT